MEKFYNNKIVNRLVPSVLLSLIGILYLFFGFVANTYYGSILQQAISFSSTYRVVCIIVLLLIIALIIVSLIFAVYTAIKQRLLQVPIIVNAIGLTLIIIVGGTTQIIEGGHIVLGIFIYLLLGVFLTYYLLGYLKYNKFQKNVTEEGERIELTQEEKGKYFRTFIVNVISTVFLFVNLFIPVITFDGGYVLLIRGIFNAVSLFELIASIVYIVLFVVSIVLTLSVTRYIKYQKGNFSEASKKAIYYNLGVSTVLLITGIICGYVWENYIQVANVLSLAFIQFIIIGIITIVHAFINSKNITLEKKNKNINKKVTWIILLFVSIFTALTFLSLFLSLVGISNSKASTKVFMPDTMVTGWDLLIHPASKGNSFLPVSFVILAIVIISSILYILTLSALFSKSNEVKRIGLASVFINFIFVVMLGLFGKYYQITYLITKENILEYFYVKYPAFSSLITVDDPAISSQVFFMIFVDTAVGVLMLIFKPFTKAEDDLKGSVELVSKDPVNVNVKNQPTSIGFGNPQSAAIDFDSCPSFTELDMKIQDFNQALEARRAKLFENPSLPALVNFIVDYARESRLHLSYTPEDIAAFIAGLGSTKLSILQGMSGTGKTSLPKIFCEAIMGNCEIVEVESSWKDKNELLGYYNEFSKIYTPKKFTRALYKASLNPNVITLIVLDEMNLSRIEYYFSDFLSLMENEPDKREIQLTNTKICRSTEEEDIDYLGLKDGHTLHVSENVWFIGTANRDESTFEISDKVYDRAYTMNFNKRAPKVRSYSQPIDMKFLPYEMLDNLLKAAVKNSIFDLESIPYISEVEQLLRPYNISFGNRIMNQIESYVKIYSACFNDSTEAKNDALETILLSKVVSKLEFKAVEDKDELIRKFEKLKLYKCSEFVKRLSEDI